MLSIGKNLQGRRLSPVKLRPLLLQAVVATEHSRVVEVEFLYMLEAKGMYAFIMYERLEITGVLIPYSMVAAMNGVLPDVHQVQIAFSILSRGQ